MTTHDKSAQVTSLREIIRELSIENENLKAEINGAIRPDGIKTQGLEDFVEALKERCESLHVDNDKYKAALKEVCQTLGPDTECKHNKCEGCKAEAGMAYDAALKALDKPVGWPYGEEK